jgi:hypothetical protein
MIRLKNLKVSRRLKNAGTAHLRTPPLILPRRLKIIKKIAAFFENAAFG